MVAAGRIAGVKTPDVRMRIELLVGTLKIIHVEWTQAYASGFKDAHVDRFPSGTSVRRFKHSAIVSLNGQLPMVKEVARMETLVFGA